MGVLAARLRPHRPLATVFLAYFVLPMPFFGLDVNFLRDGIAVGDGLIHGVPSRIYAADWSLWNPYLAGGMYRLAAQGFQALYPPALLISRLFPSAFGYNLNLFLHYAFAGFFTFLFLTKLSLGRGPAFVGGVCFMFCGFMAAHMGHHTMMNAAVWLPLVLFFVECFFANPRRWGWLFAAAIAYAMSLYADYLAIPLYTAMVVAPYLVFRALQTARTGMVRGLGRALFANASVFGIAALLAAPFILPILESLPFVTRERVNYSFFASYSFPMRALPLLLFPNIFGTVPGFGFYRSAYFGPYNLTEMAGYMGMLPVALALLAVLAGFRRARQVWFWSAVAVCGFVLVLGGSTPLYPLLFHVPLYKMFRAPARNWFEVHFALSVLASYGVAYLLDESMQTPRIRRYLRAIWCCLASLVLVLASAITVLGAMVPHFTPRRPSQIVWDDHSVNTLSGFLAAAGRTWEIGSPNVYVPLVVVALGALATWIVLRWKRGGAWRSAILTVVVVVDLASFGHFHNGPYMSIPSLRNPEANPVVRALDKEELQTAGYRVLPLDLYDIEGLFPNANIVFGVPTVTAYEGVVFKNYQGLTGLQPHGILLGVESLIERNNVLSSLGTRYLITKDARLKSLLELGTAGDSSVYTRLVEDPEGRAIYRNNRALPELRFAKQVVCAENDEVATRVMKSGGNVDPSSAVVVGCRDHRLENGAIVAGTVTSIDHRTPDQLVATVQSAEAGFLVFGDNNYPGWVAKVDGKPAPVISTNVVQKGLLLRGAGTHHVEFSFEPRSFRNGLLLLLLGLLLGGVLVAYGRRHAGGRQTDPLP